MVVALPLLVKLMFINYVVLLVANFYPTCGQTFEYSSQECERSDIIFDGEFSSSLDYCHL